MPAKPTKAPDDNEGVKKRSDIPGGVDGAVIGGIVAGAVVFIVLVATVLWCLRKGRRGGPAYANKYGSAVPTLTVDPQATQESIGSDGPSSTPLQRHPSRLQRARTAAARKRFGGASGRSSGESSANALGKTSCKASGESLSEEIEVVAEEEVIESHV